MPHAYNSTDPINNFNFFETGYIMIDGNRYDVEEISINTSRDMTPYHVAAQRDPIDQRPGKNKIEFSMKRAFSDATLSYLYDACCKFDLLLINNDDPDSPQPVVLLTDCRLSQDNIGPINGSDVVSQDLQGVAAQRIWKMCDIKNALERQCSARCPPGTSSSKNITDGTTVADMRDAAYTLGNQRAATIQERNRSASVSSGTSRVDLSNYETG